MDAASLAEYLEEFKEEKERVDRILLSEGGVFPNDGRIDIEVKELISTLNRLPFVYSWTSCSGHFRTREDIFQKVGTRDKKLLILPPEGYGFYFDGYLGLQFRPSFSTPACISAIERVVEKYSAAVIKNYFSNYNQTAGPWDDAGGPRFEIRFDTLQKCRPAVIPTDEGKKRRDQVNQLITDLHTLFSQYHFHSRSVKPRRFS